MNYLKILVATIFLVNFCAATNQHFILKPEPIMASCLRANYLMKKLLAYKEDSFVGDVEYTLPTQGVMYLSCISVIKKRQGYGRGIIEELKEVAKKDGIKKITCISSDRNWPFHEKCGAINRGLTVEGMNSVEYLLE